MKKFMLRGNKKLTITRHMPKSLIYGAWYDLVTPFDWQYFKLIKSSRYVCIYDDIEDTVPVKIVSRKKFVKSIITLAKSRPSLVERDDYEYKDMLRSYYE